MRESIAYGMVSTIKLVRTNVVKLVRIIGNNLVQAQDTNANKMVFISWLEVLTSDVNLEKVKIASKSLWGTKRKAKGKRRLGGRWT